MGQDRVQGPRLNSLTLRKTVSALEHGGGGGGGGEECNGRRALRHTHAQTRNPLTQTSERSVTQSRYRPTAPLLYGAEQSPALGGSQGCSQCGELLTFSM